MPISEVWQVDIAGLPMLVTLVGFVWIMVTNVRDSHNWHRNKD